MLKACKVCGKEFNGNYQTEICPDKHYKECIICGKKFDSPRRRRSYNAYLNEDVCSKHCGIIKANKSKKMFICKECGKEFESHIHGCPGEIRICDNCKKIKEEKSKYVKKFGSTYNKKRNF